MKIDNSESGEVLINLSKHFSNNAIRPNFAFLMIFILWIGTFLISGFNETISLGMRLMLSSIMALVVLIPGLTLFQSYELTITRAMVKWETVIIPSLWVESWEEPLSNYSHILVEKTTPIFTFCYKYRSRYISYPIKIGGNQSNSIAAIEHNSKVFSVISIVHSTKKQKTVSLRHFEAKDIDSWKDFSQDLSKELDLTVKVKNEVSKSSMF